MTPRLGRTKQVDLRSLAYPATRETLGITADKPRSYTWGCDVVLDQGDVGSCVGNGFAHELAAKPGVVEGVTEPFALSVYKLAQALDGDPRPHDGTSVLAGAKVVQRMGWLEQYRWALTPTDALLALGHHGPIVLGIDWYDGMFDPDQDGFIHVTGTIAGGHCVLVRGVHVVMADGGIDWLKTWLLVHQSWGPGWGDNGTARLTFADFLKLWPGADVCVPVLRHSGIVT